MQAMDYLKRASNKKNQTQQIVAKLINFLHADSDFSQFVCLVFRHERVSRRIYNYHFCVAKTAVPEPAPPKV